jgi:hypothetical protein
MAFTVGVIMIPLALLDVMNELLASDRALGNGRAATRQIGL